MTDRLAKRAKSGGQLSSRLDEVGATCGGPHIHANQLPNLLLVASSWSGEFPYREPVAGTDEVLGLILGAILVIDALPPLTKDEVGRAAKDLAELISSECGGRRTTFLLDVDTVKVDW